MKPALHIEVIGDGPETFVLSCGLSQTTANWRAFARSRMEARWVLFDPRGQGKSTLGTRPYQLGDHTEDLMSVIHKHASSPVNLMGFSHGGRVALNFAALHPEWVNTLVLVSTAVHASALRKTLLRSWWELLQLGGIKALAWGALPSIIGPGLLKQFQENPELLVKGMESRNTAEGLLAMLEGMQNYPPALEDAKILTCPVLTLRGGKDPLLDEEDDLLFKNFVKDCQIKIFEDSGHTLALEEPERFWNEVKDFLSETNSRSLNFSSPQDEE